MAKMNYVTICPKCESEIKLEPFPWPDIKCECGHEGPLYKPDFTLPSTDEFNEGFKAGFEAGIAERKALRKHGHKQGGSL